MATHHFPTFPIGWHYLGASDAIARGPVGVTIGSQRFAAFRDGAGQIAVSNARCAHMGADLSNGCVKDGVLHCPLHDWQYAADGRCVKIPATDNVPAFARQTVYPSARMGGHVIFFNRPTARYPAPFFDGVTPADLYSAKAFEFTVNTPWYMIGANAFDLQHFRVAHDRTLIDTPVVDSPSQYARRIGASYDVSGTGWRDRVTRALSGPRVEMSITSWAGTMILVTARFARTTSYGMVFVTALDESRSHLRNIVWIPRRTNTLARNLIDPIDAFIRRSFIRAFVMDDALRSDGVRYNPATLIDADRVLADYFRWLEAIHDPKPARTLPLDPLDLASASTDEPVNH